MKAGQRLRTRLRLAVWQDAGRVVSRAGDHNPGLCGRREIRAHLDKKGLPIGSLDILIVAHARSLDCTLVTNNEAEFKRVPRLRTQNWAK